MTEREEQAIIVLNTLYNNPLLSDIHRQALEVGIMAIKANRMSEWIPVSSGKMPSAGMWVYATCKSLIDNRDNWVIDTVYMPNKYDAEDRCGYRISDWDSVSMLNRGQAEVIAWMERIIPEAYKASPTVPESEDKE